MRLVTRIGVLLGIFFGAALQSGPDTVEANLCRTLGRFIDSIPEHCVFASQPWIRWAGIGFAVFCAAILLFDLISWARRRRASKEDDPKDSDLTGPYPNLNAAEAFATILDRSIWAKELSETPDLLTEAPFENSMENDGERLKARLRNKLDREIHDLLGLGRLTAWGRSDASTPSKRIEPHEWQKIEISFDQRSLTSKPSNVCAWYRAKDPRRSRLAYVQILFSSAQLYKHFPLLGQPFDQPINSTVGRVPFVRFRNFVKSAYKWDVSGQTNSEVLDLFDGLAQAGADGAIRFWGKLNPLGNRTAAVGERLIPIPPEHWHSYEFEWGTAINSTDNGEIATYNPKRNDGCLRGGFVDLHIHQPEAVKWMNTESAKYRGRRDSQKRAQ